MGFLLSLMTGVLATFFALLLLVYFYFNKKYSYWKNKNVPHLPPSFPLGNFKNNVFRNSLQTIAYIYNKLKNTGATYGGYYLLTFPIFIPLNPDLYKTILSQEFNHFHDHGFFCNEEIDPMSGHVLALSGKKWKNMRACLSPGFTIGKIKMMFSIFKSCGKQLEVVLKDLIDKDEILNLRDVSYRFTTDVICTSAFGFECNSLKDPSSDFRKYGKILVETSFFDSVRFAFGIMYSDVLKFFKLDFFNPQVTGFFYSIVKDTIEYREKNNIERNDVINNLIRLKNNKESGENALKCDDEESKELSVNQIAAQVFFLFFAGFETTANTLACCVTELAKCPEIQKRVRDEILMVLEKYNGELTYEAVGEMKYTEMVLYETLRKYPPVAIINRICTESFKIPDSDVIIEEGTRIVISIKGVHSDPEYYPDPDKFDPNRFTEEEKAKRHPFTFLPFGDGPRICMGLRFAVISLKVALVSFLKDYKYTLDPRTEYPIKIVSNGNLHYIISKMLTKVEEA